MTSNLRPWYTLSDPDRVFGPGDCFLREYETLNAPNTGHVSLMGWKQAGTKRELVLLPYPKSGHQDKPFKANGLPKRPPEKIDPTSDDEKLAAAAFARMNRVVARVEELEAALDDPENLWDRLAAAWDAAQNEEAPRMAEIVRQARGMQAHLKALEHRIRRVLRRTRELTPIDRVQEMDRASMLWLARQPGRSTAERAGSRQRVLSIVRHENFDTLENRVLHAYVRLASDVARGWMREHPRAERSDRYRKVHEFRRLCRRLSKLFSELGIGYSEAGVTPNYVLMEDRDYREVHSAWVRLLRRKRELDDLWSWQAESWTDFCILALTLAIHDLDDAQLIAQAPIQWNDEAEAGRWFVQDNPLAVFWLRETGRVVEVQARPKSVSSQQAMTRSHVWLRVSELGGEGLQHRVPVWPLHCFEKPDLAQECAKAALVLEQSRRMHGDSVLRQGLVLSQAFGDPDDEEIRQAGSTVHGISLDASGDALKLGRDALCQFVQSLLLKEHE